MPERTMIFVDGENLLLRYQDTLASGRTPTGGVKHDKDRFVWHPNLAYLYRGDLIRVNYYTAFTGDDNALEKLRADIAALEFKIKSHDVNQSANVCPKVFKKARSSAKTKSVDINLTTDLLRAAYTDAVDRVVVVSGDGDYIPVYEDVMRRGKRVVVGAFRSGLNPMIQARIDRFVSLDDQFFLGT